MMAVFGKSSQTYSKTMIFLFGKVKKDKYLCKIIVDSDF
jgi:hypothetical protein